MFEARVGVMRSVKGIRGLQARRGLEAMRGLQPMRHLQTMTQRLSRRFATLLAWCVLAALGPLLAGCAKPAFQNIDITGNTSFPSDFALPDTSGKVRTVADYKGKAVILLVGYTHCPDICPATMAELSEAMQRLGSDASRVQVLFVTLDPSRDTPAVLSQYVKAFNPAFGALRPASDTARDAFAKDFKLVYAKVPGTTADNYTLDHTAASYVFGPDGHLRLYARDGQGPDPWVHDLKLLLKS
jgi:protein SCO1/2